jgi:hypothetical protein
MMGDTAIVYIHIQLWEGGYDLYCSIRNVTVRGLDLTDITRMILGLTLCIQWE